MSLDDRQVLLDRIASLEAQLNEKVNAEKQWTLARSLLNAALEATADGILIIDSAGRVASCNRRFVELWQIPDQLLASRDDQRLLGYVVEQLVSPQDFLAKVETRGGRDAGQPRHEAQRAARSRHAAGRNQLRAGPVYAERTRYLSPTFPAPTLGRVLSLEIINRLSRQSEPFSMNNTL